MVETEILNSDLRTLTLKIFLKNKRWKWNKNKLRTFKAREPWYIKNTELQRKLSGSYKEKKVYYRFPNFDQAIIYRDQTGCMILNLRNKCSN